MLQTVCEEQRKSAKKVGINSEVVRYPKNVSEKILKIDDLNKDKNISEYGSTYSWSNGKEKIINAIRPSKDVDGFNPINVGNLSSYKSIVPCTL